MDTKYDLMQILECWSFKWIGQSLETCDECGKPYWDHTHRATGNGVTFGHMVNRVITAEDAQRARDIWEGYGDRRMPFLSRVAKQNSAYFDAMRARA